MFARRMSMAAVLAGAGALALTGCGTSQAGTQVGVHDRVEYKSVPRCEDQGVGSACTAAAAGPCPSAAAARSVYIRPVDPDGRAAGPWEYSGIACSSKDAPSGIIRE